MIRKLLLLCLSLSLTTYLSAQVTAGQVDDFQDSTTQGWFEAGASPNQPVNISTGGPAGAGDMFLQDASSGNPGPGGRMVMRNVTQWAGDYTGQGIVAIKFDARVTTNDLDLRVAMNGSGGAISSNTGVTVTAGSGWTSVVIPIAFGDMQTVVSNVGTGTDVALTLAGCSELRILSNSVPSYAGEQIDAILEVDNIEAATTLDLAVFDALENFKISPNPGTSRLNIVLPDLVDNTTVEVFDVLGKRIYFSDISRLSTSVDVSQWPNGVYLVKVYNSTATQTKRFVKQ